MSDSWYLTPRLAAKNDAINETSSLLFQASGNSDNQTNKKNSIGIFSLCNILDQSSGTFGITKSLDIYKQSIKGIFLLLKKEI